MEERLIKAVCGAGRVWGQTVIFEAEIVGVKLFLQNTNRGNNLPEENRLSPTILLSVYISLIIIITTTMMMGRDLCKCLLIGRVHTINSYAAAERSRKSTEVTRSKHMILTSVAPCNGCFLRVKLKYVTSRMMEDNSGFKA